VKRRWPVLLAIAVGTLPLAVAALGLWIVASAPGTRWALQRVQGALGGRLRIASSSGTLAGPLELRDLRYRDADTGIDLVVQQIRVDLAAAALLRFTLHIESLDLRGVRLALHEPATPPSENAPFSLQPPLDIRLDALALRDARVTRDDATLLEIDTAALAANWTGIGLELRQLDVQSPQGEVHFTAQLAQRGQYEGKGAGRFRWRVGEHDYAGRLEAHTQDSQAQLELQLAQPVAATLHAQLGQEQSLPWRFTLELPAFDPRTALLPQSSLQRLGARLQGSGTAGRGTASGTILLNSQALQVEKLGFARAGDDLEIDALLRMAQGRLQVQGAIQLSRQPVAAQLKIGWQDVVIPADLAGQVLRTQGQIDFAGSAQRYGVQGRLTLGPPQRPADIQLRIAGSPTLVELQQVDIVQPRGRLAATGTVTLQPRLGWQVNAQATKFDPGAFAVAWPGNLDFKLRSSGARRDDGVEASLQLDALRGRLRNRVVAGDADLRLAPDATLSGTLDLRSGQSRLRVAGRTDAATATIDVATLDDWLPGAAGRLHAQLAASGRWPALHVTGNAQGSELRAAEQHAGTLRLDFDITTPLHPEGSLQLALQDVAAGDFEFTRLALDLQGSERAHRASIKALGQPLAFELAVQGALQEGAWHGELQELTLEVRDVTRLRLTQPVRIAWSEHAASVSEACLAERDLRLCFAGELLADRALHAKYSLQNVPLALTAALLAPELPLAVRGTLQGEGDIRRDARGLFSGRARLQSLRGEIAQRPLDEGDSARQLLAWNDLALDAALDGAAAHASLAARLDDTGSLQGALAATGLDSARNGLSGNLTANLPSIAVLEVFAPQVANLQGRLALQTTIAGTLDAPQFGGQLSATGLALELPDLGLKLHDGALSVTPQGGTASPLRIAGEIASGKGKLEFTGSATTAGAAHIGIRGADFLAADIPGVRVNITPALQFERSSERMTLNGNLRVQGADIDLQKLPRGDRAQAASSDVVVVDDDAGAAQQRAQSLPLYANLTIDLGEQVKLVGFGLDATVAGQFNLRERPGEPTTGSGEIRVAGTYKAYGQDLEIRQGQLLYAQTPLDNPRLSIVAVRVVDTVTAGLRVSGTAQNPQLAVFSDPVMAQSGALSYLVAGKPLDQVGSSAGESDALRAAAQSLGTAAGGLLAKNIGKRLGVDELGIKDSAALGGAALTVGQYLSPRLYLSYGVGLFTPGEVLTLRYKLAHGLSLEAENAAQNSRAGVKYRIER
jgi:translocation and assembly module TamB